jgi:type II secretory pathway pseudopilin PulG
MQALIDQVPASAAQFKSVLQQTGFEDVKYLVWDHKTVAAQSISQAELSFVHPRHGVAAWLAPPRSLGSLDFVSPKPLMAFSIVLSNPQKMFTDIKDLLTAANPNALAMLTQSEQMLGVSLENDFLKNLDGEITVEISGTQAEQPAWKVVLRTSDSAHLQQALTKLLSSANMRARSSVVDGTTYYDVRVPSRTGPAEISYSFVNGYLVLASSHTALAEALSLNQTGNSLGKSKEFLASLPLGHSSTVSALFYEDPVALMSLRMAQVAPESAGLFASLMGGERKPLVICAYGEESAISEATSSASFDPAAVMIGAAIAIPNLLRARIAANESSAVGAVRTIDTAQITYSVAYPRRRYAPDLAALGPDPSGAEGPSPAHASLLAPTLANSGCTAVNWCIKNGFRFKVTGTCKLNFCADFVALGTPLASNTGSRSFCSTSDGVVRAKVGPPLTAPIDIPECRSWQPLR